MNLRSPQGLQMRKAILADLPYIIQLLAEDLLGAKRESPSLQDSYVKAFNKIQEDPGCELFVAEFQNEIVGTLQMNFLTYLTFQGSTVAQIESVHIAEKYRGKGFGASLMTWAIERARSHGCQRVQLTTNKIRKDAHRFYERLGFNPTHEGMKLYFT